VRGPYQCICEKQDITGICKELEYIQIYCKSIHNIALELIYWFTFIFRRRPMMIFKSIDNKAFLKLKKNHNKSPGLPSVQSGNPKSTV
jgi:hypothetical protein